MRSVLRACKRGSWICVLSVDDARSGTRPSRLIFIVADDAVVPVPQTMAGRAGGPHGSCRQLRPDTAFRRSGRIHRRSKRIRRRYRDHLEELRSRPARSEEHTSELQSRLHLVCRLLLEKKKKQILTVVGDRKQEGSVGEQT